MVKIAILGFGKMGSATAELLMKNARNIAAQAAQEIEVKYILDVRDFSGTVWEDKQAKDFSVIENDPEVSIVVSTIGVFPASIEYARRTLRAGKHLVTSDKELVSEYGDELIAIARENNLNFLFEGSVGGGIPIIRPLTQCLAANNFLEICGILNGTTNYILTKMRRSGATFDEALAEAQEKGYAEANPSADVDGVDACRKICILSDLAFGYHVKPAQVHVEGIRMITSEDVNAAQAGDYAIKLVGRAKKLDDGRVGVLVAPHLISSDCPLASVEDVFNGIMVTGDAVGEVMFYGQGAGRMPTASAIVGDIIDTVKHFGKRKNIFWNPGKEGMVADEGELEYRLFVRAENTAANRAKAEKEFPGAQFIYGSDFTFITPAGKISDIREKISKSGINVLSTLRVLD